MSSTLYPKKKKKKKYSEEDDKIEEGGTHPYHEPYTHEGIIKE